MTIPQPFDPKKLARTTRFQNNCLLHCIVPTLVTWINEQDSSEYDFDQKKQFKWLMSFRNFYGISNEVTNEVLLQKLKILFTKNYSSPVDQELILGPVLRDFLASLLLPYSDEERPNYSALYFENINEASESQINMPYGFLHAIQAFLQASQDFEEESKSAFYNISTPNLQFITELKKHYKRFCTTNGLNTTAPEAVIFFMQSEDPDSATRSSIEDQCKNYWDTKGGVNFAKFVQKHCIHLSFEDAIPLFKELGIQATAHFEESYAATPTNAIRTQSPPVATLKLITDEKHFHWEYEECTAETAQAHNAAYCDSPAKWNSKFPLNVRTGEDPNLYNSLQTAINTTLQSTFISPARATHQIPASAPLAFRQKANDKIEKIARKSTQDIAKTTSKEEELIFFADLEKRHGFFNALHKKSTRAKKAEKLDTSKLSENQKKYINDYFNKSDPSQPASSDETTARILQELEILKLYNP